jgi:predicted Zn finger-like uncharacterized protein
MDVVTCPHCQSTIQNSPAIAGKKVRCGKCTAVFSMPPLPPSSTKTLPQPVLAITQPYQPELNYSRPTKNSSRSSFHWFFLLIWGLWLFCLAAWFLWALLCRNLESIGGGQFRELNYPFQVVTTGHIVLSAIVTSILTGLCLAVPASIATAIAYIFCKPK